MISFASEEARLAEFPVAGRRVFFGHAGVTALPACAAAAMQQYIARSCENHQEIGQVLRDVARTRVVCARLIDAEPDEIALLGPTSLGLSLFANGLDWREGDEILCYRDDYPSNVYPWANLDRRGVRVRFLDPGVPGKITPKLVDSRITAKTRLVALASCHFLSGWRIDTDAIGELLRRRGVLFSLDAIQTLGAFATSARHVDFLSADAHKWMLGPVAVGIVFVAKRNFELCRPTLLGAWNVRSPDFVAQPEIRFVDSAQRYEPGVLNLAGIYGMHASLEMLLGHGISAVSERILWVADYLHQKLAGLGFEFLSPSRDEPLRSGIVTCRHPRKDGKTLFDALDQAQISASLRCGRDKRSWLRFSPHFYNTRDEVDRTIAVLAR